MNREEFKVKGDELLAKIKEIIHQGNIRKIIIMNEDRKEIMSFPVTVAVAGAMISPILAAVGAIAALVGNCTIIIEKEE